MVKISAIAVIRNESKNLLRYINHVRRFCDEVIIVDQQSTDNSLEIALKYADRTFLSKNVGYCELDRGNIITNFTKYDWICTLDPDERFENKIIDNITNILDLAKDMEAIEFDVHLFYDGIQLLENGEKKRYRLTRKHVESSTRIHTTFFTNKIIHLPYIQYHFKELELHKETIKRRHKLNYEERVKNLELKVLYNTKKEIIKNKKHFNDLKIKLIERLEKNQDITYLELTHK